MCHLVSLLHFTKFNFLYSVPNSHSCVSFSAYSHLVSAPLILLNQILLRSLVACVSGLLAQLSPHPPCRPHCVSEAHAFPSVVSPLVILVSFSLPCPLPQCLLQTLLCFTNKFAKSLSVHSTLNPPSSSLTPIWFLPR